MKELALLLMVFWPGEAPEVDATLQKAQILWQDAQAFWNAMLDGNACAIRASLNRLLRDLGARTALAQGNCQCSSCMFAVGQCAVISPECATPCVDDPTKYCLYCVNGCGIPGREYHEIGRFDTAEEWQQALQEQMQACGCGGAGADVDECGRLYYEIVEIRRFFPPQKIRCCKRGLRICWGNYRKFRGRCRLECERDEACGSGFCFPQSSNDPHECTLVEWTYYDCSGCCDFCTEEPNCGCPAEPTGAEGKCVKIRREIEPQRIEVRCLCGGEGGA